MTPKALVFDMDGTLLDTLDDLALATNNALSQHGYPSHSIDAYRYFVGSGARELIRRALPDDSKNEAIIDACLASFNAWYHEHWNVNTRLYDGVAGLLDYATKQHLKLAVLTNKPQAFALQCQAEFLSKWPIAKMQGHEDGIPLKPDASVSQRVTDALNLLPSEIWYFGDSDIDMMTATIAGYRAIGVTWGFRSAKELKEAGADVLVDHPSEIIDMLNA